MWVYIQTLDNVSMSSLIKLSCRAQNKKKVRPRRWKINWTVFKLWEFCDVVWRLYTCHTLIQKVLLHWFFEFFKLFIWCPVWETKLQLCVKLSYLCFLECGVRLNGSLSTGMTILVRALYMGQIDQYDNWLRIIAISFSNNSNVDKLILLNTKNW